MKKISNYRENHKSLDRIKNQIRGAFSKLTSISTGKDNGTHWKSHQRATEAINKALTQARTNLPPEKLEEFEHWVDAIINSRSKSAKIGTDPSLLGLLPKDVPSDHLSSALTQAFDALKRVNAQLRQFSTCASNIAVDLSNREWAKAEEKIDAVVEEYGHSYWSIETKICILHSQGHPSRAKDFIEKISIGCLGLNRFYFYHFGLRNEASQSTNRYKSLLLKRISDSELSEAYKTYADFRTARVLPADAAGVAKIINYEQLTTRIDLLFTTLKVSINIVANQSQYHINIRQQAEEILNLFGRPLLHSILKIVEANQLQLSLSPELQHAIKRSIYRSFRGVAHEKSEEIKISFLEKGLAAALSYSGSEADEEQLRKHILNLGWLPDSLIFEAYPQPPKIPEIFLGLRNSVIANHSKNILLSTCEQELLTFLKQSLTHGEVILLSRLYNQSNLKSKQASVLDGEIPIWKKEDLSEMVADCLAVDEATIAYDKAEYFYAIRISAHAVLRNIRLARALPLQALFGTVTWRIIASYGISVELCNCLHHCLAINDERQTKTFKRFAIEELMFEFKTNTVGELCQALSESTLNRSIVEQFLTEVCDLPTLELLPGIECSREALKLREYLLRTAAKLSRTSSAQLIADADDIAAQLEVDSVLNVLDESKVYVDEGPLLVLASREFAADFERYIHLVASGISQASSLEDILKSLRHQSPTVFKIPKNEADDLLVQMLSSLLDMFMNDPVNGLDSVIGRRLRHGTISSELRGTLEHLQLIGQRPRSGADYDAPNGVASYMAKYEPRVKKNVNAAFGRFAQAVDNLVIQLRDEVFQCQTKGKLKPAFELNLNPFMFTIVNSIARDSFSIEAFGRECFQIFWFLLSQIVERERPFIEEFTKKSLRESFTKLLHELRNSGVTDPTFLASIQKASEQLQHKASLIANWIRIPRVSYEGKAYPLGLVFDVAMTLVKSQRPGFEPTPIDEIEKDIQLDAHGFPIVHDALQIALDNIAQHSGVRQGNNISVKICLDAEKEKLCFNIVSDLAKDGWTKEKATRTDAIRDDIAKRSFADRAKRPSGSGLSKLAGIVHQRDSCALEFGPIDNNQRFNLYFELMYITNREPTTTPADQSITYLEVFADA